MAVIRQLIQCVLTVSFLVLFILSIIKWAKNEIGTRTHTQTIMPFMFPSITICPTEYNSAYVKTISLYSNFSFEDFQNLPTIKDNVIITIMSLKTYHPE